MSWIWPTLPPQSCLNPEVLRRDVEDRLASAVFARPGDASSPLELETAIESAAGEIHITLTLAGVDGEALGERALSSSECEELRAQLPVVVAILLAPYFGDNSAGSAPVLREDTAPDADPVEEKTFAEKALEEESLDDEAAEPVEEPPPDTSPLDAGAVEERDSEEEADDEKAIDDQAVEPAEEPSPDTSLADRSITPRRLICTLGAGGLLGFGPKDLSATNSFGCTVSIGTMLAVDGGAGYRYRTRDETERFDVAGPFGRLAGCSSVGEQTRLGVCAGMGLSQVTARANFSGQTPKDRRIVGETLGWLRFEHLLRPVVLRFDLGAILPWQRPVYFLAGEEQAGNPIHQAWPIWPMGELALGVILE